MSLEVLAGYRRWTLSDGADATSDHAFLWPRMVFRAPMTDDITTIVGVRYQSNGVTEEFPDLKLSTFEFEAGFRFYFGQER